MQGRSVMLVVSLTFGASVAAAQSPADSLEPGRTVTVAPGTRYRASGLHRAFFGSHYRDLWATPIRIPVLDLQTFAGGLRPIRRGGGKQTKTLRLESADGRKWAFRSVDKDPSPLLPPELRRTIADRILQDQISATHPAGPLVVSPLLEAVGVKAAPVQLFVMPNDPSLGEFRDFAGVVGALEERPSAADDDSPGFEGARKVADTQELFEKLDKDSRESIDTVAYLKARLMDVLLGDWDRHGDQWRWLKIEKGKEAPWEPVPYDRDQVFVRYDGLLLGVARAAGFRQLVNFGNGYSSNIGITWNARFLDRRLLVGLRREVWDSLARDLQARLTDPVIDGAVRQLPPEYFARDGKRLATALKHRRDALPQEAAGLYQFFARDVDVHVTQKDEVAVARRNGDGTMDLTIRRKQSEKGDTAPFFHRHFKSGETSEVRLYLAGGSDSVHVEGNGGGPRVRVIGSTTLKTGDPKVVVDDAAGGTTKVYDTSPKTVVAGRHRPSIDRRPYSPPDSMGHVRRAPRDWGHLWRLNPWMSYAPDVGLFIGGGPAKYDFGFRQNPYAKRLELRGGYATGANRFRGEFSGDFRFQNSGARFLIKARASGIEVLRFFGFGNETAVSTPDDFFKVFQEQYSFSMGPGWELGPAVNIWVTPVVRYSTTDLDRPTFIGVIRPYGSDDFGMVGGQAGIEVDTRDNRAAATRGVRLEVGGSIYPKVWDVRSTFGEVHGEASAYLHARMPLQPTLALRAGGQKLWGDFPFFDAASIGGPTTVRGLRINRYIGDASAWGNAELRLRLSRYYIILPGEWGVFGLADAGRVWQEGQSSSKWHHGFGGGLWFAPLTRTNAITVALARSEGRTGVYVRAGFMF
jgi:hypothetical protein